jgi:hypothetical protein
VNESGVPEHYHHQNRNVSISNPNDAYTINIVTRANPQIVQQRLPGQERSQEWIAVTGALPITDKIILDKDESGSAFRNA